MAAVADEISQWGATEDVVEAEAEAAARAEVADQIGVWPENWNAFRLFLRSSTQWRAAPHGGRMGLDYLAVEWVAQRLGIEVDGPTFEQLQAMELEALAVWAEERERAAAQAERERDR